jgi:hypothetical protein
MNQPKWITPAGSLGTYPSGSEFLFQMNAVPVFPATFVTYKLLSGQLPSGIKIDKNGKIFGSTTLTGLTTRYDFTIRVTDNLGTIRDRSFFIEIAGVEIPKFLTEEGEIFTVYDSIWVEKQIEFTNPTDSNVKIYLLNGKLPPGLEINSNGLIRGYPLAPVDPISGAPTSVTYDFILVLLSDLGRATARYSITVRNFTLFFSNANRKPAILNAKPLSFTIPRDDPYFSYYAIGSDNFLGEITSGDEFQFKVIGYDFDNQPITYQFINLPPQLNGDPFTGWITGTPATNEKGINRFSFSVKALKPMKPVVTFNYLNDTSVLVAPNVQPLPNNKARFNAEDLSQATQLYLKNIDNEIISIDPPIYGRSITGIMNLIYGKINYIKVSLNSDVNHYVLFEVMGSIQPNASWFTVPIRYVYGSTTFSSDANINVALGENIVSSTESFYFNITNDIQPSVTWITESDLGVISNGTLSTLYVQAASSEPLVYRMAANPNGTNSALPPNLFLLPSGEIYGKVAFQPNNSPMSLGDTTTYTFTIEAYSEEYPLLASKKTFNLTVSQDIESPVDTIYFKASPNLEDRAILSSLLDTEDIIPTSYLYRPTDIYFGKSREVIYPFAYGMTASSVEDYIRSVDRNHYKKSVTLGELRTAQARDENNNVIYEVVYSVIIDDQVNNAGKSISQSILWPTLIYSSSPWFTSTTNIYTSYENTVDQKYYTSLTSNTTRRLYPNSFDNMLEQVKTYIPQNSSSKLLPLWMTSQQENGSTLGFVKAWVICYTKPGFAAQIKNNIETQWQYKLNQINFEIDRYTIDKSSTYNYDTDLYFPTWTEIPSASPVPDPLNSTDQYVLFPRQTILPN